MFTGSCLCKGTHQSQVIGPESSICSQCVDGASNCGGIRLITHATLCGAQAIDDIVEVLIEKETISGEEFRQILGRYTTIPEENKSKFDKILA